MIDMKDARQVLAATLWGEARGEEDQGMDAVACVVMNRARRPRWWGRTVLECATHPWQFSCWLKQDPNRAKMLALTETDPAYAQALAIADLAIKGALVDITHGADSYYAVTTPEPNWAKGLTPVATIGHHAFYRTEP